MFTVVCATVACILAGAALAVSLTHTGPRGVMGPVGPQGSTGHNATVAHLGVCWNMETYLNNGGTNFLGAMTAPVLTDGVPSCPTGQFVSVVPQGN